MVACVCNFYSSDHSFRQRSRTFTILLCSVFFLWIIMAKMYNFLFKLVLIGDSDAGKTAILQRFMEDSLPNYTQPTLGM